jgi:hypothetical protein
MLYRRLSEPRWSLVDLNYNAANGWAEVNLPKIMEPIEYFAQAVDPSGNVALSLNHGTPYTLVINGGFVYLPLLRR